MNLTRILTLAGIMMIVGAIGVTYFPIMGDSDDDNAVMPDVQALVKDRDAAVFVSDLSFVRPAQLDQARSLLSGQENVADNAASQPALFGIAQGDGKNMAWIALDGASVQGVGIDEMIGAWRVVLIEPTKVELINDDQTIVLQLFGGSRP